MKRHWRKAALAAALLVGGCSGAAQKETAADDGAWMDGAIVMVEHNLTSGRETVTLKDGASGFQQQMNEEALSLDVVEGEDSPDVLAALLDAGITQ
jgi:hypothetical protein